MFSVRHYLDTDGVIGSSVGRDELDLMKLIIDIEGDFPTDCQEKMKLDYEGDIAFYLDYRKINPYEGDFEFSLSELPTTLYVECRTESTALRDISIRAFINEELHDEVKATAIWTLPAIKYIEGNIPEPSAVVNDDLAGFIYGRSDLEGNYYGLGYFNNSFAEPSYGGRILIEYTLLPSGVENLPVYFDITRRLDEKSGLIASGESNFTDTADDDFQEQVELGNDDSHNIDTDASPLDLLVYDAPAGKVLPNVTIGQNTYSYKYWLGDFEEFTRMSFNPIQTAEYPDGELIIGSRCSDVTPWFHGRTLVLSSDSTTDPYSSDNQRYVIIETAITHSVPTRINGSGTGSISVELLSEVETKGYTIYFPNSNECKLYSNQTLIDVSSINNNNWVLEDLNKIKIVITNELTNPYIAMTRLYFSTMNNESLYSNIKIQ